VIIKSLVLIWEKCKGWLIFSAILCLFTSLFPIITIWLSKELVNHVALLLEGEVKGYRTALILLSGQFMIIFLGFVLEGLQIFYTRKTEIHLDHDFKKIINEKNASIPYVKYDDPNFYNHLKRISSSPGQRFLQPIQNILEVIKALISVFSFFIFLFSIHYSLFVLSLLSAIPIFIFKSKFGVKRFLLLVHQTPKAREIAYVDFLLGNKEAAKEIRIFNLSSYLINRWSRNFKDNTETTLQLLKKEQVTNVLLNAQSTVFYLSAAGIIIWLTKKSAIRIGEFVAVGQAIQFTQTSLNKISTILAKFPEESLYLKDFFDFLDIKEEDLTQECLDSFPIPLKQSIRIENISFKYPNSEKYTLQNLEFSINVGEKIAIVGENGSGKSTFIKCLMGLYPVEGNVYFDQISLKKVKPDELRDNFTVIFQDFMKYSFSIKDNIAFGNVNCSEDEIYYAAKKSGVNDFSQHFINGLDTNLGKFLNEGEELSGGQWQKIALARALVKKGQIMIFDEPTSALDPDAEVQLYNQFKALTKDKTAIYISHRMSAAKFADKIYVFKNGKIIESGNHEFLMRKAEEYSRMYKIQAEQYSEFKKVL
jgi:ATP-binding cassette, subfamily B, bacterial